MKTNIRHIFLSYPILCPFYHLHQRKQIKMKFTELRIYFNVACQVHIVKKSSTKCGHFIAQVHNTEMKWYIKPRIVLTKNYQYIKQKLVDRIMKKSNVREYPIARDTLLITDA